MVESHEITRCSPSALTAKSRVSAKVFEEEMSSLTPMASAAASRGRNCSLKGGREEKRREDETKEELTF